MKNQTFYNREKPLFERKHVPFELIASNDHGKIGHGPKSLSKRKAFFTIRVLQGHRAIQNNAGSSEKSIRLELSDEHRKVGKQTSSFARKNVQQNPMVHVESKPMSHWQLPNHGPIHFPAMQHLPAAEFVDNNSSIEDDEVLIDSLNAINLYELEVGESDFAQLRQDQALLVDFSDFSKSFIELLLLCDLGREDGTQECKQGSDLAPQTASSLVGSCSMIPSFSTTSSGSNIGQEVKTIGSQFTCRIEDFTGQGAKSWNENKGSKNGARFSIVESNQFRELVHLSLDIRPGSDETVRSYLSARLNEVLGQNAMLKFQLGNEKHRANINEKACNDISRQYNEMLSISEKERCTLAQEAGESIQKESTMRLEELQIVTRLKEDEIQSLKDKVGGQLTCLQTDLELMGNENNRLIEENQDKNKALQNLEYNLDKYESALELARSDMESLKREFQIVKSERDDMEEDLKESQIIVSKLEASNGQYESRVAKYQNESKMTSKYAQDSKHEASNYSNQLRNAQGELDTTKVELGKANELLVRYQRDRQEIKRRMKSKADLIQKQEEILASVEFRSTELQERFVDKETECGCLGKELSMAKQHLSQARQKVEENQRTLASNQQVGCPREMFRWKFGESVTYIHICLICSFLLLNDFAPAFPHSRRLLLG